MIDKLIYRTVRDNDYALISALDLRKYTWGSLEVYNEIVKDRMQNYNSKYDLLNWLNFWTESWRLASPFVGIKQYEEIKKISSDRHERVLQKLFSTYRQSNPNLHNGYDIWNAIDSHIILNNCEKVDNILDFGSGYGRLGLIFGDHIKVKNYFSVDCVELSYILQNLLLSAFSENNFYEYCEYAFEKKEFFINLNKSNNIYHLPTWKLNLIPDKSLDLTCAVFVLPEINDFALIDFVENLVRTTKTNGYLYVRDHLYHSGENNHIGGHRYNTEKLLLDNNFKLIFQDEYQDNIDIYGIPRIYQLKK